MNYRWNVLSKSNNIQDILRSILKWKNIPKDKIREFIDFNMTPHNPYLLTNMDKAIKRIEKAIETNEKIMIAGDYDADGVTATAVMYIGLRSLFSNVIWKLPDRFKDGYGLNKNLIDYANTENCTLIITVDNGIVANQQIKYANSLGIDVIVTDHHQMSNELPTEITVNPHIDDSYPFKSICGCMVAFKVIMALLPKLPERDSRLYRELLSITSIGTIADVMELVDENRYYVKKGLEYLSDTTNIGLRTLMEKLKLYGKELSGDDIGYIIGPCLNAAGRLESPDIALNLLLSDDPVESEKLADKIIKLNDKRKQLQKEALDKLVVSEEDKFIIVKFDDVGHGILGIIAGQVADKYKRPCFVLSERDGKLSGSGRSVFTYNLYSVIHKNRDIVSGGGHAAACGLQVELQNLEELRNRCNEDFKQWLEQASVEDLIPSIDVVSEINLDIISGRLINNINKLKPYGNGNDMPLFVTKNVKVNKSKVVGKNENVIQMELVKDFHKAKAVGFNNIKELYQELGEPMDIDIVYSLDINEWPEGVFTPQLIIKDLKKST